LTSIKRGGEKKKGGGKRGGKGGRSGLPFSVCEAISKRKKKKKLT